MSTSNGRRTRRNDHIHEKSRHTLSMVLEKTQYDELQQIAARDQRSLASLVRDMLRQGIRTRHGDSAKFAMHTLLKALDTQADTITTLTREVAELRTLLVAVSGKVEEMRKSEGNTGQQFSQILALLQPGKRGFFGR